jgi:hypothetical protein
MVFFGAIALSLLFAPWAPIYAFLIAIVIGGVLLLLRGFSMPSGIWGEREVPEPDQPEGASTTDTAPQGG